MTLTVHCVPDPRNGRNLKIYALAALANIKLDTKACSYGVENMTDFYQRNCSPARGYPTLQTEEGFIFESEAIMRHIARMDKSGLNLYGRTPYENSQVDMWMDFASTQIAVSAMPLLQARYSGIPLTEEHIATMEEVLQMLETWLENRTFLVAERLTAADLSVAFTMHTLYIASEGHGERFANKFKNAYRFYNTVMQQPKIVQVLTEHGASIGYPKMAKEPKKQEAKKPEAKKPAAADEDDDETVVESKKKPNPLDLLPPSSFVLDAFKREYSNTDTRTVAAPYFFDNYDPNGYTCFWCRYKYNEENKMQFMTANLIRGWFQRMEHTRKYTFGIALIIGEEKQHDVVGFWVFRGQGMPAIVEEVVDTELFDWEQIKDVNAEKEKITDYLCWEGPTIGRPVLEGRCFK